MTTTAQAPIAAPFDPFTTELTQPLEYELSPRLFWTIINGLHVLILNLSEGQIRTAFPMINPEPGAECGISDSVIDNAMYIGQWAMRRANELSRQLEPRRGSSRVIYRLRKIVVALRRMIDREFDDWSIVSYVAALRNVTLDEAYRLCEAQIACADSKLESNNVLVGA